MDLVFAEHCKVCSTADVSWNSQLEDSALHSWRGSIDVNDCKERRGKPIVEDADLQETFSGRMKYRSNTRLQCPEAAPGQSSYIWENRRWGRDRLALSADNIPTDKPPARGYNYPPLAPFHLKFLSQTQWSKRSDLSLFFDFLEYMYKITFVDMGFVHYYQPWNTGLHYYRWPTASKKGKIFSVLRTSKKLSEFYQDDNCIDSLLKEPLK